MNDEPINIILKNILGKELYSELIAESAIYFAEHKETNLDKSIEDIPAILEACCIALLLIGISKKPINIDEYIVNFEENRKTSIGTKEFCQVFKKYIDKVEEFKIDMLKRIS